MPFNFSEDTVKAVSLAFNNARDFILKPASGWTFTIALCIAFYIIAENKYDKGVLDGKTTSKNEIESFKEGTKNDSLQIKRLQNNVSYLRKQLDTCNSSSANSNLVELLQKKLDESDRIRDLVQKKYINAKEINTNLKQIPVPK